MRRFIIVATLAALAIWVGAGCQNLKEVDFSLTGMEMEWYEPPEPVILEAPSANLDLWQNYTNQPASWLPRVSPPRLMQREGRH
jgi:hypothetical protein